MRIVADKQVYAHCSIFSQFGEVLALPAESIDVEVLKDADVLVIRSKTLVNAELLEGSNVRYVLSTVSGTDHIDLSYLQEHSICFFAASGCNATAVAEYVVSACFSVAKTFDFSLQEKVLGIVGVGHVGQALAKKAHRLGISVLLCDSLRAMSEGGDAFVSLRRALGADVISFHTPLTYEGRYATHHLLGEHNFDWVGQDSVIINTARGGVIDEASWLRADVRARVVDCWVGEPNISTALHANAYWATPHIAGHSLDAKYLGSFWAACYLAKKLGVCPPFQAEITPRTKTIVAHDMFGAIAKIHDFRGDCLQSASPLEFKKMRENYPPRYEWHHFTCSPTLP